MILYTSEVKPGRWFELFDMRNHTRKFFARRFEGVHDDWVIVFALTLSSFQFFMSESEFRAYCIEHQLYPPQDRWKLEYVGAEVQATLDKEWIEKTQAILDSPFPGDLQILKDV